jgi:predicted RNase H-like HicB family nuclease
LAFIRYNALDGVRGKTIKAMKRTFTVVVERDPESGWLVGEVVELPGWYPQAPDLPSLEKDLREAILGYLKTVSAEEPLPDFVRTWRVKVPV